MSLWKGGVSHYEVVMVFLKGVLVGEFIIIIGYFLGGMANR